MTPSHAQRGRIGGLRRAATAPSTRDITAPARAARMQRWIDQAIALAPDPTDQADVARRADLLMKADMAAMSLAAAKARNLRSQADQIEAELDAQGAAGHG